MELLVIFDAINHMWWHEYFWSIEKSLKLGVCVTESVWVCENVCVFVHVCFHTVVVEYVYDEYSYWNMTHLQPVTQYLR